MSVGRPARHWPGTVVDVAEQWSVREGETLVHGLQLILARPGTDHENDGVGLPGDGDGLGRGQECRGVDQHQVRPFRQAGQLLPEGVATEEGGRVRLHGRAVRRPGIPTVEHGVLVEGLVRVDEVKTADCLAELGQQLGALVGVDQEEAALLAQGRVGQQQHVLVAPAPGMTPVTTTDVPRMAASLCSSDARVAW